MASSNIDPKDLHYNAQHNLKAEDLAEQYSEEELAKLLDTGEYDAWVPPKDSNEDSYAKLKSEADKKTPRHIHKWHPKEDAFLRTNYMFLTDVTVSLALNIPVKMVIARRRVLGLIKKITNKLEVMIWCNRTDFDKDMAEGFLTKARPDII